MVHLVTGKKGEGKTTKLMELFSRTDGAAGFIAKKISDCGRITRYDLLDLKTGKSSSLAKLTSLPIPEDWTKTIELGPFTFDTEGFAKAAEILASAIRDGAKIFFIDELGKLELDGKGHADTIRSALKSGMDLYIAVRDSNLRSAIESFGFEEHEIIKVR